MQNTYEPSDLEILEPVQTLEQLAAETCALLTRAGVDFAIAEAGTGGEIARLLRCSSDGRAALTQARIYATPEALGLDLRVSSSKLEAFGALSAMVAAEAAADLIDTYEGGWGVVTMIGAASSSAEAGVESAAGPSPDGPDPGGFVALGTPSVTVIEQCPASEVARTTLRLLGEQAERRLKLAGTEHS